MKKLNEAIVCSDGFKISVQARAESYCTPRDDVGPYTHVECGYPSEEEPLLMPYAEDPSAPTDTVYGWVPRSVVTLVIAKHGGVLSGQLPKGVPYLKAKSEF